MIGLATKNFFRKWIPPDSCYDSLCAEMRHVQIRRERIGVERDTGESKAKR